MARSVTRVARRSWVETRRATAVARARPVARPAFTASCPRQAIQSPRTKKPTRAAAAARGPSRPKRAVVSQISGKAIRLLARPWKTALSRRPGPRVPIGPDLPEDRVGETEGDSRGRGQDAAVGQRPHEESAGEDEQGAAEERQGALGQRHLRELEVVDLVVAAPAGRSGPGWRRLEGLDPGLETPELGRQLLDRLLQTFQAIHHGLSSRARAGGRRLLPGLRPRAGPRGPPPARAAAASRAPTGSRRAGSSGGSRGEGPRAWRSPSCRSCSRGSSWRTAARR